MEDNIIISDHLQTCSKCHEEKPLSAFPKDKNKPTGFRTVCKDCTNARTAERYANNENGHRDRAHARNNSPENREKERLRAKERRLSDPEWADKRRESGRRYMRKRRNDPAFKLAIKEAQRKHNQKNKLKRKLRLVAKKYGIPQEQIEKALKACGNKCPILGIPFDECGGWVVDHCHITGVFRGLLSRQANLALGNLRNSAHAALKAAQYLERNELFSQTSKHLIPITKAA